MHGATTDLPVEYEGKAQSTRPTDHTACPPHRNSMCPMGRALKHPAAKVLEEWATFGCPTCTGKLWTIAKMWEAVDQGPHCSALSPEAIAHFKAEGAEKVRTKQARLVLWEDIKDNPPRELQISPIAAIPHKSKDFWSILDLSFHLRLENGGFSCPSTTPLRKRHQRGPSTKLASACPE
jgi:hypothetical protein